MTSQRLTVTPEQLSGLVDILDAGLSQQELDQTAPEFTTALVLWKRLRSRLSPAIDPIILPDLKP